MKVGIDLGGSHIAIGLVNDNNEIIQKRTYYMADNKNAKIEDYIISNIKKGIDEIIEDAKIKIDEIELIGIASPGNPKDGVIKNIINLGIQEIDIRDILQKEFKNIEIKVENDGKCAGIAEKRYGSLKDYDDAVFLCIGTGIGGAAFLNGEFLKPKRNSGFEFGHMVIAKGGEKCPCGNYGCFECYCSKRKFKNQMSKILGIEGYIGAKDLIVEINNNINNPVVYNLLDTYIENLAIGISNIINILEPQAISIGGSMSHYESLIFEKLKDKVYNGNYLFNKENPPVILSATAGNDAGIIGATLL